MKPIDTISTAAAVIAVGCLLVGVARSLTAVRSWQAYYASSWFMVVTGLAVIKAALDLADTDTDGWGPVGFSLAAVVVSVGLSAVSWVRAARLDRSAR